MSNVCVWGPQAAISEAVETSIASQFGFVVYNINIEHVMMTGICFEDLINLTPFVPIRQINEW